MLLCRLQMHIPSIELEKLLFLSDLMSQISCINSLGSVVTVSRVLSPPMLQEKPNKCQFGLENVTVNVTLIDTIGVFYLHDTPLYSLLRSKMFFALAPVPACKQRTNKPHCNRKTQKNSVKPSTVRHRHR